MSLDHSPLLLEPSFAPITFSFGFLESPLGVVCDELQRWYGASEPRRTLKPFECSFPDSLHALEPLSAPGFSRLWIATTSPRWRVAYFDGFINGGDPFPPISYLAQQLGCEGLTVTCVPQSGKTYGANRIELYGPVRTDWLNLVWTVSAMNDGGPWVWNRSGPTFDFEEASEYSRRRVRDRFTSEMLRRYCEALGVPLTAAELTSHALLDLDGFKDNPRSLSLAQARAELGLP